MVNQLCGTGVNVEAQPPTTACPRYSDCDTTGVASTGSDLDEFDIFIDPSTFDNNANGNQPLQYNTWPIQPTTGRMPLAGADGSPTFPTQHFYIPVPSSRAVLIESTGWPTECIPWWSQTGSEGTNTTSIPTDASSWDASTSEPQSHNTRETSLASPTTDPGHRKYGPDRLPDNLAWTTSNFSTSEQSPKSFNSKDLGPPTFHKSTIDLTEDNAPTNSLSDATFDPTRAAACTSPRSPQGPTRASSSRGAQSRQPPSHTQSPSSPRGPERSARNRTAANKSRAKNKAATAELVAAEQAESQRHQQLSATCRSLQDEVFTLKSELLQHGSCDDLIIQEYFKKTARLLAMDSRATTDSQSGNATSIANSRPVKIPR